MHVSKHVQNIRVFTHKSILPPARFKKFPLFVVENGHVLAGGCFGTTLPQKSASARHPKRHPRVDYTINLHPDISTVGTFPIFM